jgi:hypothetical protein
MKRFFAFGCSFTKWAWPTWADMIGINFPGQFYNYGSAGAGNMYIFNAVMEADQQHHFTKDDLIIVQWTSVSREDRYTDNKWQVKGTIANHAASFVRDYFDFKGFLIRDLAAIKAVSHFLNGIGCEHHFLSMIPLASVDEYEVKNDTTITDVLDKYADIVSKLKISYRELIGVHRPYIFSNGKELFDAHPTPKEHHTYLKEVLPHLIPANCPVAFFEQVLSDIWSADSVTPWLPENQAKFNLHANFAHRL